MINFPPSSNNATFLLSYHDQTEELKAFFSFSGFYFKVKRILFDFKRYRKDTESLYHSFMYSLISLLSSIYPLSAMPSLLVTLYVSEYLIGSISNI